MNTQDRLKEIEMERLKALDTIYAMRDRIAELSTEKQNIIMSQED